MDGKGNLAVWVLIVHLNHLRFVLDHQHINIRGHMFAQTSNRGLETREEKKKKSPRC
jgi:hypothetical protein